MNQICARDRELKLLDKLYHSGKSEFLAIYGRRRVGKTFLIREFFKNQKVVYFALTGVKGASLRKQLKNFFEEFKRVFGTSQLQKPPKDWSSAFAELRQAIAGVNGKERIILFFDELPWLATARSGFLQDLDHFWNRYMSEDARIVVIVCGSAASWMISKIIRNKGGLHGRLTAQIRLLPFDLKETEQFLEHRGIQLNRKAIIDIYMAIGGIPKYLNYVQKGLSAVQIINQLCFEGPLESEFNELYSSLFESYHRHVTIVKALADSPCGLTKNALAKKCGLSPGGGMNLILEELEQSGFILTIRGFGNQKKESRLKLIDEYSLFYLKWSSKTKENSLRTQDDQFWIRAFHTPQGRVWAGYAFEMLCLKHLSNIKKALGIEGVLTNASGWSVKPPKKSKEKGAQIDLLIDRADNCINLCEMKYYNEEFVIDKSYDQELRNKKEVFLSHTKSRKSVFITLISPYGVKNNVGYFETVDVNLSMNDLF